MSFFSDRKGDDLDDEINTHLALLEEDYRRRGMSAPDAHDAARRAFGGVDKVRQLHRAERGLTLVDAASQDIKFALRVLRRDRGFALTAILVLGLGIGVNNMMFTLVYGATLRGMPIDRANRVLYIATFDQRFPDRPLSHQDFVDLTTDTRSFQALGAFFSTPLSVGDEGRVPDRFDGAFTSAGMFAVIGAQPLVGRTLTVDDDRVGSVPVAVLGRRVWQSRYNSDPALLGRTILVNGSPVTVIGILPDRSGFPSTAEVWLPLSHAPGLASQRRDTRTLRVIGRVRDDVTVHDARADVESVVARIARDNPDTSRGLAARVVAINQRFFGRATDTVWLAFITASVLVVLVSCANAANLMIARSVLRAREIAIRSSLGASRTRMIVQLLVEAFVLAALGGAVGLGVSIAGVRTLETAIPENSMPYWTHFTMDWGVFAALIAVSLATVVVFGLIPAIQASKTDVNRVLKEGGRGVGRGRAGRLTSAFLVAEFALSVVLLAQFVVNVRSDGPGVESDAAIDSPALLAANVTLPAAQYATPAQRLTLLERVREQLEHVTGIASASVATHLPLRGGLEQRLDIDLRSRPEGEQKPAVSTLMIGPRYFATLQVPMQQGREFSVPDGGPGRSVAIVNERFAQMYLAEGEVLGRQIRVTAPNAAAPDASWLMVVGVAANVRQRNFADPDPLVYLPLSASPAASVSLIVRTTLDPAATARLIREAVTRIDPHLPVFQVMTMRQSVADAQWNGRVSHNLILTITLVALALSMVGLYAATAYAVGQRTQEIGIRMALGARPAQVRRLIVAHAVRQVAFGLVLGLVGSMAWDAAFASGSAGLQLVSPSVIAPVALLLALMTVTACAVPARRATRLDPVVALRQN